MEYSTLEPWQEVSETGIVYSWAVYMTFFSISRIRTKRKAQYCLLMFLMLIFLAILSGKDTPVEIADWAKNHAEDLARLLGLKRSWMPHHSRRWFEGHFQEAFALLRSAKSLS